MLVLSRKQGESIEFPGLDVVVRVISLKRSKVQLGIEAPRQISVHRSERVGDDGKRDHGEADQQILDALTTVEAELAALAELASQKERPAARRIAADSIDRLEGIKRSIRLERRRPADTRPIADYVQLRAQTLQPARVRQPPSDYAINQPARCAS